MSKHVIIYMPTVGEDTVQWAVSDDKGKLSSAVEQGLLSDAAAKVDGDMSAEEKAEILRIFSEEFHMSKNDAAGLLISSSHLLGKGEEVQGHLQKVMAPSLQNFTPEQAASAIELITRVTNIAGSASELQRELISNSNSVLASIGPEHGKWS